jgi:Phage portal protein, lambda family
MKITQRLEMAALLLTQGTRVGNALAALFNHYEAAATSSPNRSFVPAFVRDARYDANSFSRWEMTRKIRDFERNMWLVQRLRDEHVKWTVGPNGLQVIPASSDTEWNAYMLEDYQEWCESPCLDQTISMPSIHKQIAGEDHIEGEVFVHETAQKKPGYPSEPAVQLVRSHRISSPGTEWSLQESSDGVVDGVQLGKNAAGKLVGPIGYWIRDDFLGSDPPKFRSRDDVHHVFEPAIPGMYRNITPYHGTLDTLADLFDLEMMEMTRAKANAEDAKIFKTVSGELPASAVFRNTFNGVPATAPSQEADMDVRLQMYRRIIGARTIALKTNEEMITPESHSPSAATQWFWRHKIGQVCSAANIPLLLVFPEMIESAQGTVVRGIYDNAHEFFRGKSFLYARAARRMYRYRATWARYNNPKLVDAPADWAKCHVIPPRAVNVDVGHTTESKIAELEAGLTDYDTLAGANSSTAEVLFRKKGLQIAMVKRIAAEITASSGQEVRPEEIAGSLMQILETFAKVKTAQNGDPKEKEKAAAE